jgi:hypothetical protein
MFLQSLPDRRQHIFCLRPGQPISPDDAHSKFRSPVFQWRCPGAENCLPPLREQRFLRSRPSTNERTPWLCSRIGYTLRLDPGLAFGPFVLSELALIGIPTLVALPGAPVTAYPRHSDLKLLVPRDAPPVIRPPGGRLMQTPGHQGKALG